MKRLALAGFVLLISQARSAAPIRIMLLDGESAGSYHDWKATTPVLKKSWRKPGCSRWMW